MLTFLYKIRRSLTESGSARKYLLYAIGEIAVVVISILIALQINNWNQEIEDRKTERYILVNLAKNLELNINQMNSMSIGIEKSKRAGDIIFSVVEE